MSKNNGNGLPPKQKNDKGFERHHFKNPDAVSDKDGISIVVLGDDEILDEIQIIFKAPGSKYAQCLSFRSHEMLTDMIEQLIAYRRLVFPDAPEINTNATLEE